MTYTNYSLYQFSLVGTMQDNSSTTIPIYLVAATEDDGLFNFSF